MLTYADEFERMQFKQADKEALSPKVLEFEAHLLRKKARKISMQPEVRMLT